MKCFGAFNYYVCSRLKGDGFSERGFDLLGDIEFIENRRVVGINFHDVGSVGGY